MKKSLIGRIGVLAALLSATLSAAAYDFESGGICYNILSEEDKTVEVTSAHDDYYYKGDINIPAVCQYSNEEFNVVSIGREAFFYCKNITSIDIPSSVTSIGKEAFSCCSGLTSITIPNSVTSIGEETFSWCENLRSVAIPNSVTSIGTGAFRGCEKLTDIEVDSDNKSFTSVDGVLYDKSHTRLLCCPGSRRGDMIIPNSVTSIEPYAFYYCAIQSITIPNSVRSIGEYALAYCGWLETVVIPNSVTSIEKNVFSNCYCLTSVTIPNSVTSIGEEAFQFCFSLPSVIIPSSVTSIGASAFDGCERLTSITIPSSVTRIGEQAFAYCDKMTTVYVEWEKPLENCGSDVFIHDEEIEATLYVPRGCAGAYKAVEPWMGFSHIQEYDVENGIDEVEQEVAQPGWRVEDERLIIDGEPVPVRIFNAAGTCVYAGLSDCIPALPRGIYVARIRKATVKLAI